MGAPGSSTSSVATTPAFVSVADVEVSARVASALRDLDLTVTHASSIAEIMSMAGDDRCVVVVDAGENWLRDMARLCDAAPGALPVLIGGLAGPDEFLTAIAAGVVGFCQPDVDAAALGRTIRSVLESGVAIPRQLVAPLVAEARSGRGHVVRSAAGDISLTDREWEILQMLLQRRSTREIAEALFVSVGTVRSHVSALVRKLGATSREDAIALIERGGRQS